MCKVFISCMENLSPNLDKLIKMINALHGALYRRETDTQVIWTKNWLQVHKDMF